MSVERPDGSWTPHNLIAHPAREVLMWAGWVLRSEWLQELGQAIHDGSTPGGAEPD